MSRLLVLLMLLLPALLLAGSDAAAQEAPAAGPRLSCAVEWQDRAPAPQALCDAIGRRLGRATLRVEDARAVKRGESVQVLDGDVFWTTVWLRNGRVQAYTRVSKTMAQGKELDVLTRAVQALSRTPARTKGCTRVEPNGGRRMRSPDLAYPWVELKRCQISRPEVADPWVTD
jgi:hypothetical protein